MRRGRRQPAAVAAALALLAACAADAPQPQGFDDGAGRAVVELLGDGFCRLDGARVPFDAMLLRLRLRMRGIAEADRTRFVVEVRAPAPETPAMRDAVQRDLDRLVQQLNVMDVVQVEYR